MTFEMWADGTKVADRGLMTTADGPRTLSADLTGATILRLVVTDGGNGNDSDHADWAAAQLTCALRPPPAGTTYLSDISCQSAANGWGPVERDESVGSQSAGDGRTLAINGHTYEKGLGTHAPADIRYYLGGACTRMQADVGVDDEVTDNSTLTFQVWADDTKVFDSGLMTWQDDPRAIDADVTGAGTLRLVVTDYDGTNNSDHADWGGARITCGGAA